MTIPICAAISTTLVQYGALRLHMMVRRWNAAHDGGMWTHFRVIREVGLRAGE